MASMFKNLKSLFVVTDNDGSQTTNTAQNEDTSEPVQPAESESISAETPEPATPYVAPEAFSSGHGEVSDKFLKVLFGALEKANLEGFDYFEYKQALQNMKKMDMDEQTMYQSAFASAQIMGATPALLKSSAEHYIKVLNTEEQKFEDAWEHQAKSKIDAKVASKKKLADSIAMKKKKITELEQQIEQAEEKLSTVDNDIESLRIKANKTRNDFITTWKFLSDQIKSDITKMSNYLK